MMKNPPDIALKARWGVFRLTPLVAGSALVILGAPALMGWSTRIEAWLQPGGLFPFSLVMTSLLLVCTGVSLLCLGLNLRRASNAGLLATLLLLLPSLLHYLLGIDFSMPGLTESAERGPHSLILPLNTVIGMTVAIMGLGAANRAGKTYPHFVALCGSLTVSVGFAAFLGFLFDIEGAYAWTEFVPMSAPMSFVGSLGLSLAGASLLVIAYSLARRSGGEGDSAATVFLLPLFLGVSALTLVLWQALLSLETEQMRRLSRAMLDAVRIELRTELDARMFAMDRMAARWISSEELVPGTARVRANAAVKGWQADALLFVKDFPEYRFIHWADTSGNIAVTVSPYAKEGEIPFPLDVKTGISDSLRNQALVHGKTLIAGSTLVEEAYSPFQLVTPIGLPGSLEGFFIVDLHSEAFFKSVLEGIFNLEYDVSISQNGKLLYASAPQQDAAMPYAVQGDFLPGENPWQILIWPRQRALENVRSPLPTVVLFAGLVMGLLLTAAVHLREVASKRLAVTESINAALQREVQLRTLAEANLLRKNEEIEKQNRLVQLTNTELEAFSYSVSHDLKTPLRSIDGFSRTLLTRYEKTLDEQGQDYLRRIQSAGRRMTALIDALLNLSRLTRSEIHRNRVDLSSLAVGLLDEMKREEPGRNVQTQVEEGLQVDGDRRLLEEVLGNLLENAWKFTGGKSPAEIVVGKTRIDEREVFFVRDNGAGFDSAYAGKLFVPFQRLHHESEFPGTGIGLATVQRIIHKHGGKIWAESAVGKGATFYFTLPASTSS